MTRRTWRKPLFMGVLARAAMLGALAALAACDDGGQGTAQQGDAPPPSVTVVGVSGKELSDRSRFVGRVEAHQKAALIARVSGFLQERSVDEGAQVSKGQILFRIEPDSYEADLAQAKADLAEAKANLALADIELERDTKLLASDTIAQSRFDATKATRESTAALVDAREALVNQAALNLGYTEIKAPFSGRIGAIAFSEGEVVGPEQGTIATVIKLAPMDVVFSPSEGAYIRFLKSMGVSGDELWSKVEADEGPKVNVILPDGERLDEVGQIIFVDNRVDPATGTIPVRARFDNTSGLLTPGIFVTVEIESRESVRRLLVPQASVQRDQRGDFVLAVNDKGMVEPRYVTLGRQVDGDFVVEDGLQEGDSVIVEGLQRVRPGVPVNAVDASGAEDG